MKKTYLDATQEQGKSFYLRQIQGNVTMLNLLKFREIADYSAHKNLAPDEPISGKEAYRLYMKHTKPFLEAAGGEVIFYGKGSHFLIGPEDEKWDAVLLVKQKSTMDFLAFAQNTEYLKGIGHRMAALEDSRLLPIESEKLE